MQAVKSEDTSPELGVRRFLHAQGYRYRLHKKDLPGSPDLVFVSQKKVIFVHGCFWHGHGCPRGKRVPKSNTEYWIQKIARNRRRDEAAKRLLEESGWSVLILWECELRDRNHMSEALIKFLQ